MDYSKSMIIWKLKKGADRRVRAGHPWVYSNELQESPKGIDPGAAVELQDFQGQFLARGYGNPHSLIAFRVLSRHQDESKPLSLEGLSRRLRMALDHRKKLGFTAASFRLSHGEADQLPGLIIDSFSVGSNQNIYVAQAHTAGAQKLLAFLPEALSAFDEGPFGLIYKNDVAFRKLEGLEPEDAFVVKDLKGFDFSDVSIFVRAHKESVTFSVDLLKGQKTGFFLDQGHNISLLSNWCRKFFFNSPVRILDLCAYVGQWSVQVSSALDGHKVEVTAVDASEEALMRAKGNIERTGARCETVKADVLKDLSMLRPQSYDVVICDPPALIKGRKDLPTGQHGYLKLNTMAMEFLKPGSLYSSSSCSGLLEENDFASILTKATRRAKCEIRWLEKGQQSLDHPIKLEFPEGQYLKNWLGYHLV